MARRYGRRCKDGDTLAACHGDANDKVSSGTSRLHEIKARLYNSGQEEEGEIQMAKRIAQGMRRHVEIAELWGEASKAGNMLATCVEF